MGLQYVARKRLWTSPGGNTHHEAQRRLSGFLKAPDAEIQRLSQLTTRELGVEERRCCGRSRPRSPGLEGSCAGGFGPLVDG